MERQGPSVSDKALPLSALQKATMKAIKERTRESKMEFEASDKAHGIARSV